LDSGVIDVRGTVLASNATARTIQLDAVVKDPIAGRSCLVATVQWQLYQWSTA
jgi:hypothetical protein